MRVVLIIGLLVCLAALLGWISYSDHGDTASLNFDKQEARNETREAADAVEEAIDDAAERIEEEFDADDESHDDPDEMDVDVNIDGDRRESPRGDGDELTSLRFWRGE